MLKVRHDQFGVHPDEFLSQHTVQQGDIAGMNAKAIVDHRKMPQAVAVEAIHRQHHVGGIERMSPVSTSMVSGLGVNRQEYDVAPDGRFLINQPAESTTTPITLILNWRPPKP